MKTWYLLGAGAIGGLFACQLQAAGFHVKIVTRSLSEQAYQITLAKDNREQLFRFSIWPKGEPIEQLILSTKTYHSLDAMQSVLPFLADRCQILVLQNGMGVAEKLAEMLPNATILAASTTHGAYRVGKDHIVHAGVGQTWLGPLEKNTLSTAKAICSAWAAQGVPIEWDEGIQQRRWLKLAINCAINPLTLIYDCKNGALLKHTDAITTMKKVCQEFSAVYQAKFNHLLFEAGDPQNTASYEPVHHNVDAHAIWQTVENVLRQTANNISSIWE